MGVLLRLTVGGVTAGLGAGLGAAVRGGAGLVAGDLSAGGLMLGI